LVGGTHYYTQALLFKDHIIEKNEQRETSRFPILEQPTEVILAKLREIDPIIAERWHPNDRRKIQRSLEIWLETGKLASDTYLERLAEQSAPTVSASNDDATYNEDCDEYLQTQLRFPTLVLWVYASTDILRSRLDVRVQNMVRDGLLAEVEMLDEFKISQETAGDAIDRTRGIWVSIGYKEFEAYQATLRSGTATYAELANLKANAIEQTQAATRQYAKRQIRWIRIKLLNALARSKSSNTTFLLDGSDITNWKENVQQPAVELAKTYLDAEPLPDPLTLSSAANEMLQVKSEDMSQRPDLWVKRTCDACGVTAATLSSWETHIKSRRHRKRTSVKTLRDPENAKLMKAKPSSIDLSNDKPFLRPLEKLAPDISESLEAVKRE
jgi:tRNA dimethylallyltransferase